MFIPGIFRERKKRQGQQTILRALCDELGLNFVKGGLLKPNRVLGEVNGWYVTAYYLKIGGAGIPRDDDFTIVAAYYAKPTDFSFNIQYGDLRNKIWSGFDRRVGIATGIPEIGLGNSELYYHTKRTVVDPQILKSTIEYLFESLEHMRKIGVAEAAYGKWLEENMLKPIEKSKGRMRSEA